MSRPRVLLADDHSLVLEGIRKLLDTKVDLVGTVGDGRALVKAVEDTKVDVVLLDISMPLLNGIEAARQIKKFHLTRSSSFSLCTRIAITSLKHCESAHRAIC